MTATAEPADLSPQTLTARLGRIRDRIAGAGGDPDALRIVAVTKGFGADAVRAAVAVGLIDIGENYAQELATKAASGAGGGLARWHMIGPVQRNKVRHLAPIVACWQTVDGVDLAAAIARHHPGAAVLVQVNVTGEASKSGCSPSEATAVIERARDLGLDVQGLMTVGPTDRHPAAARLGFAELARLARRSQLAELSMGMSDDLEVAVREGATMVRLGTALFGPRPARPETRR